VAAAHEVVVPARAAPVPPALAPVGAAARPTPPPAVVPTPARAPRPIEHPGDAAPPPPRARAISAGPRPRVALHGEADPLHADAVKRAGHAELDTRLAGASERSAGDLGVSQLAAPVRTPPAPALPAVTPPPFTSPAIAKSPWHRLPAETQARLDARVAPGLGARVAAIRQRAQADDAHGHAELAQLRGDHDARVAAGTQHAQAQLAGLRDAGAAGVHGLRGQWQAQSVAARDHAAAEAERDHAAAEAEIQTTVRTQEGQSDAILGHAETTATGTRDAAEARARQIRADAQARTAAARARSPGAATLPIARLDSGDGDGDARAILEAAEAEAATAIQEAQAEIDHLMASAGQLSSAQIGMATMAVARRLTALRASLATKITDALHKKFPDLEKLYLGQINTLLDDTQRAMVNVGVALATGNTAAAQQQIADERKLVERRTQRVQDTLQDAAVLSTFDDTTKALDAFDIHMVSDAGAAGWTSAQKQLVLAQAIRIENALRADDTAGLFAQAKLTDPGAAFKAIMNGGNGLTLRMQDRRYTDQERQDLLKANPDKYKTVDDVPVNNPSKAGGSTKNASEIDFYTLTSENSSTGIADATMFHLGHEMGHAFNDTIAGAHSALGRTDWSDVPTYGESGGALGTETIKAGDTAIAGKGVDRFVLTQDVLDQFKKDHPKDWKTLLPAWAQAQSEKQGMRAGTTNLTGGNDYLRLLPYQQDDTNDSASNAAQTTPDSEWFADIYVNWANGTLADNAAGDALDGWMDKHMPDWIRMRLQASGKIPKDTATPTPTATPTATPGG
jgi:hypothetical protein